MEKCHWEKIDGFSSIDEFRRFQKWMSNQVFEGMSKPVSTKESYAGENLTEEWYVCTSCNSTWRLVKPDPGYFNGVFCRVL